MTRRAFEWLQVGDVRREGDYTVSSMNGWMWAVPESMWDKPIKSLDMPVFRPIAPAADSPLKPLDSARDTILSTPPLGYRGEPAHSAKLPALEVINESFGGWDALGTAVIVVLAIEVIVTSIALYHAHHG